MPGLDDYGALLRSGSASVTDYAGEEAKRQLLALKREELQAQAQKAHQEVEEQDAFQHDLATILTNPNAQGYSALIAKHPKFAQQVKSSWDVLDHARQDADLQSMSEVYSAAANKKFDLAGALMQRRIDADKNAGQPPDPHDQAILDALKSPDPVEQKAAMGMIGVTLSAVTGPDKFEQTLGELTKGSESFTLSPGSKRYNPDGTLVAEAPFAPREVSVSPGEKVYEYQPGGGDPASGAAGSDLPPAQAAVASTLAAGGLPAPVVAGFMGNFHAEGGYTGAKGDGGTSGGIGQWNGERAANFKRIIGKNPEDALPEEGAKFALWEMQNPEAAGMTVPQRDAILAAKTPAQAAALIDQYYERSSGEHRQKRMAAATRFAGGGAPAAGGGPRLIAEGAPPDQGEGFDPQAVEFSAQQYLATGQMPTLGMGKAAALARKQIIERAAKIAGADGLTGTDFAQQIAHFKSATQALKTLETQAGTVEANEKTAMSNGQQFIDRSGELSAQTNYPIVNSATQAFLRHTGDPTIAAMDAAWNTFTTEYAKVVAGSPSGAGTLSDSARHEAQATMKGNYSLPQKKAAFKQMQADMANRMVAIHSAIAGRYATLTKNPRKAAEIAAQTDLGGLSATSAAALPKGAKVVGTYQGRRVIQLSNGKRMVEQ